jgi:hypothetical protein
MVVRWIAEEYNSGWEEESLAKHKKLKFAGGQAYEGSSD